MFLQTDGCSLHTEYGTRAKPTVCRRYPFALVATPAGGRITTAHRCQCRTLGERPLLEASDAGAALRDSAGRLQPTHSAPPRIALSARTSVSFATYVALESLLIEALRTGKPPHAVLDASPQLPPLRAGSWHHAAATYVRLGSDPSRTGHALRWFGMAILDAIGEPLPGTHPRPWKDAFDRAERGGPPVHPELVLGDYLADELWGLAWLHRGPFDRARSVTAALAAMASAVTGRLVNDGVRPDRAAAEAILVVELGASQPIWRLIVDSAWPIG